jgi:hypothetical protein
VTSTETDIHATEEVALIITRRAGEDAPLARPRYLRVNVYVAAKGPTRLFNEASPSVRALIIVHHITCRG